MSRAHYIFTLAAVFSAGCQTLPSHITSGEQLSGEQLTELYSDHVYSWQLGRWSGSAAHSANGYSYSNGISGESQGRWRVVEDRVCTRWDKRPELCSTAYKIAEKKYRLYREDGSTIELMQVK